MLNYFVAKNITKAKHRFPLRQIRYIPKFLRNTWPVFSLVFISLSLAYLNYKPNTFLTGWDNLHPEFDIWMNFKRTIFSVWQEYRGTGLLSGQAPAADLPRFFLISLFQLLKVSLSDIRYLTTFISLVLGPIGVYFLFYHHLFREKLDSATTQFASFFGGLFYLLNLGTLQTFFVPFETFTWFYGALPYLLYFTLSYLKKPSLPKFSTLLVVSFLAAPSFYVETIFLVLLIVIIPFFIEHFFQNKNSKHSLKTVFLSSISIILPHLFWLSPIVFFVFTKGAVVETAKINNISSIETYYRNLQFATIKDLALIKGYLFNYLDMGTDFKYDYLLPVWRDHLSNPLIGIVGFLIFSTVITGLYYSIKKKFVYTKAFISTLLICLFFLLGGGLLINRSIPLIGELFRSPFTKFSIPLSLAYSFFFAIGTIFLLDLFTFLHSRLTYYLTLFTVTIFLLIFVSPAFSGNLISPKLRVQIPQEYFDLFSFLKTQDPATRIANFPQNDFWGWLYYDWGYRGSGFLWHGLKQPLLDRAFDVWEPTSEKYYEEISSAIYNNDQESFEKNLKKYAVNWILLDKHIIPADGKADLGLKNLEGFLASRKYTLEKSFSDKIYLYKTNTDKSVKNFLSLSVTPSSATCNPSSDNCNLSSNTYSPFSSLSLRPNTDWIEKGGFLSTTSSLRGITTEGSGDAAIYTSNTSSISSTLSIPSLTETESLIPARVEYQKSGNTLNIRLSPVTPIIIAGQKQIDLKTTPTEVSIPLISGTNNFILQLDQNYYQIIIPAEVPDINSFQPLATLYLPTNKAFTVNLYHSLPQTSYDLLSSLSEADPTQCYTEKPNRKIEKLTTPVGITLLGTDVVGCLSAKLPLIPKDTLLSVDFIYSSSTNTLANVNITGKNLAAEKITQPLESSKTPRRAQLFVNSAGGFQQANFILEAADTKSVQEIEYRDVALTTHELIFSSDQKLLPTPAKEVALDAETSTLQISLPLTNSNFDIINTAQNNSLLPESLNCDQFNQGKTIKVVNDNKIIYQSQNAIECDYQNLRHLPHSLNYLISINVQNKSGLPLTLCLENFSTRRCDIFDRLLDKNASQYLINPISNKEEPPGYTLHLFNQSIGNRVTTNSLKSLSIRPIPLTFLKNISVSPSLRISGIPELKQSPQTTSTHPAEYLYTISIPTSSLQGTTTKGSDDAAIYTNSLNLFQTKSPFWQALIVSKDDVKLPYWLLTAKIFFTYPKLVKLPHADQNLWHNSWLLPSSSLRGLYSDSRSQFRNEPDEAVYKEPKQSIQVAIIYLPQYLEFLGFALIALSLPILIFLIFRKNRASRHT